MFLSRRNWHLLKIVQNRGFIFAQDKVAASHRTTGKIFAMKCMKKSEFVNSQRHLKLMWNERSVIENLGSDSPFLCQLLHAFQVRCESY